MNSVSRGGHSRGNVMPLRGSAFAATGGARDVVSTHPGAAQEARHPTTAQEILRARVIVRLDFCYATSEIARDSAGPLCFIKSVECPMSLHLMCGAFLRIYSGLEM